MEIIKLGNKNFNAYINLSEADNLSIDSVISILKEIESIVVEPRDIFEIKYAQKFLEMIKNLKNSKDITLKIDEILFEEDLLLTDSVFEILNSYLNKSAPNSEKPNAKNKKSWEDKYEQLKINLDERFEEEPND